MKVAPNTKEQLFVIPNEDEESYRYIPKNLSGFAVRDDKFSHNKYFSPGRGDDMLFGSAFFLGGV